VVLDAGRIVFDGPTADGLLHYHRLMGTEHSGGESFRPARTRALEIVDVELRDAEGRQSSVFRTGTGMQIAVQVRASGEVQQPSLTIELRNGAGLSLFRSATPLELSRGNSTQLVFEISDLRLLGGDYDLALGAAAGSEPPELERTLRFSVPREPGPEGALDLRGSWRILSRAGTPQ
jgi:hypothetical protein